MVNERADRDVEERERESCFVLRRMVCLVKCIYIHVREYIL